MSAGTAVSGAPLLRRWLAESRRDVVGWSLGLSTVVLVYVPLYASLRGTLDAQVAAMPPTVRDAFGMQDVSTGAAYVQTTVFGLLGMVLLTAAAVAWGSRAVAGDEEAGGLELVVAASVSRRRVVLERAAAVLLLVVGLATLVGAWLLALRGPSELGIDVAGVVGATLALAGLAALHGGVALAAGAATGRRSLAVAAASATAVLGYLASTVLPDVVGGERLRSLSPFDWAYGEQPLRTGVDWSGLGLLWGGVALLVVAAVVALDRRDVGT